MAINIDVAMAQIAKKKKNTTNAPESGINIDAAMQQIAASKGTSYNPQPQTTPTIPTTNRPATTTAGRVSTPTPARTFTPLGQASRLGVEPSAIPENYMTSQNREYSTSIDRQNRYGGGNLPGQQARIGATLQDEEVYNKAVDELMRHEMAKYSEKWNKQNTVTTPTGQANRLGVDTTTTLPARNRKQDDDFWGQAQANYDRMRLALDEGAAFSRYMNDPTEANKAYSENIKALNQGFTDKNANLFDELGPDGKPLGEVNKLLSQTGAGYLPQFFDQMKAGIGGAIAGGAAGSVVPVLGTAAGAKAGYVAGTGVYSYNQMQGAAYSSLIDAGIDEQTAMRAASDEALVSSMIEMADAGFDLAMLGGGKLISSIAGQGIKQTAKALAKEGAYDVAESALKKYATALAKYGLNILGEGAEEFTQEYVSMANIDRMKSGDQGGGALGLAGDTVSKFLDFNSTELKQAGAAGMEGMKIAALMGGASAAVNYSIANGIDTSKAKSYGKMIKAADLVDGMVSEGLASPKDSVAYDLASKLSEKVNKAIIPSDADVGKLYIANSKYAATKRETLANVDNVDAAPTDTSDDNQRSPTSTNDTILPTTQEQPFTNDFEAMGKAGMDVINRFYDPNIDRATYYADFARVYTAAKNGQDVSTVDLGVIDENTAKAIYVAQEADAVSSTQQKYFGKNSGLVRNQTLANARIPSSAKRTLDTLAKTIGVKIELVDSITDADGFEANASISGGVIRVAMNSEQPLFTATVHEAVHRIKSADADSYNQLRSLVFKALQDSDKVGLAKSLKSRGKTYDTLNQDTISEELVADAIGYALGDEKTLRQVLGDNRNLIQKVYDAISDMITAVRRALGNKSLKLSKEQRAEFAALEKNLSDLQRTVKTALANVKEVAETKNTAKPTETKYSLKVSDKDTLDFLNGQLKRGEVVEVYRAMQRVDGKLYPPMAGTVNGEWQNPTELNAWEASEEITDFDAAVKSGLLKTYKGKNGETLYKFNLTKGATEDFDGGTTVAADYAPYIHTSLSMLNDQFTSAYKRNNLVVVRGYVPNSELYGAYQAKGAKKSTGETTWHSGVVSSKMPDTRRVILSRYFMPVEVLNDKAVAQGIKSSMKGKDIEIPYNVVSPGLRRALEAEGVSIGEGKGIKNLPPKSTVRYSLKDSDGRQLTEAQAEFFKDSKVRDEDGNLLVVYHGSPNSFTEFDTGLAKNKPSKYQLLFGTHFTTNKEIAGKYAREKLSPTVRRGNGATVYEAHLNIKNPLDLVNANTSVVGKYNENSPLVSNEKMFNAIETVLTPSERKKYKRTTSDGDVYVLDHILDGVTPARAQEIVLGLGYDGIKYNAKYAAGVATQLNRYTADVSYIALYPSQIKSIDNANPTDNPDIRYSLKDSEGQQLTEAQAEFFKDSKVRDENGNLLRMYHGTSSDFTVFDKNKIGSTGAFEGTGFNFTPSSSRATSYAGTKNGKKNVLDGYVNVTNPLSNDKVTLKTRELANLIAEIDPTGDNLISNYAKDTKDYGAETFIKREALVTAKAMAQYYDNDVDIYSELSAGAGGYVGLMDAFKAMGYDGLIHYNQDGKIQTVITFDSSQFKNFDNANPTDNPDIRYSLKQMDKAYLSAAEAGDTETAQRMVDEAAKKAGYTIKAYHGTPKGKFNVFSKDLIGSTTDYGWFGKGFYFTTKKDVAEVYADSLKKSVVISAYLRVNNVFDFGEHDGSAGEIISQVVGKEYGDWSGVSEEQKAKRSSDFTNWLRDNGYDGAKVWSQYLILDADQAKSADAITRDDEGNIIPLSERFNPDNEDIRFSRKGVDEALDEFGQVEERREKLEAQIDPNKIPKDFRKAIGDLAKKLFDEYGSTLGVQKGTKAIANDLYYLFDYIATQNSEGKELTFNEMYDKAILVARNIVDNSLTLNDDEYRNVKELVDYVRSVKIRVPKDVMSDIADYQDFMRRNFGILKLSSNGDVSIQDVYRAIGNKFPGEFDEDKNPTASGQLQQIEKFVKTHRPIFENQHSYDLNNAAELLADEIVEKFYGLPKQVEENKANAKVRAKERIDAKMLIERERAKRQAAVKDLVLTYGAIKRGENPVRDVQVPKQTGPNNRVRQFARTAMESGVVTDKFAEVLDQALVDGVFSYDPTTDRVANDYALITIQARGIDKAMSIWDDVVYGSTPATKEHMALGQMLAAEAIKKKDYATAQRLIAEIAAEGTRAGQIVQAMRLLKKMSGPAQMYYVDKVVDNLQKDLNKRFKKDTVKIAQVKRQIKSLEEQTVTAEQLADVAAQKVEALKELKKAVEQFEAAEAELAAQQKAVEDTKNQIAKYRSGKTAATKQTAEIAKKVSELETKLTAAEEALAEARKRRDKMAAQKSMLLERLNSTLSEIDKANRREYSDWWNAQLLTKEIGKAQEELKAAKAKADEAKSLKQQIADLKRQLKDFEQIEIPDELRKALVEAKSQEEIDAAVDAILTNVAEQVPSTWFDKWNAWRYLAMLGNPRTHIRNLFGNAIFVPMVTMKNIMAAGIEAVVKPEVRTKSLVGSLPGTGGEYKDFAITDYAEVEEFLHMGGKMNPSDIIRDQQRMFSWSTLEWLRKQNFKLLEKEDNIFLKFHYTRAMTQYLSSNNINLETMDGKTLQAARDYAIKEAQKATYRDASAFANTLNKMSKKNTALGIIIEGIMPFKKTPVNILKRGMEYSPLGILDTVTRQSVKLKNGDINVNEYIDRLASGLTGTGVMALGMYLASQGLLTASMGKDKEDEYEELLGEQEYSIVFGDTRYSIDWMMPVALPLFLGAEIHNANQEEYSAAKVLDAAALIAEPLFNLSMLNGLNNTIKAAQYEDNPLFAVSREVLLNYFGQAIPTLSGQVARTIDDTRRTTYTDKNSPIPTALQYPLQRNLNKIPWVAENSLPYIDAWGRTEKTGKNMASRAAQNMLSPGYVSTYGMSKMEKELKRLAKASDDNEVLPSRADKSFQLNGEDYNLTADQYEKYATKRGQTAYNLLTNLIDKQTLYGYSKLSNTDKAAFVKRVYDYANALAKMQVSKYEPNGWIKQAIEGEKLGIKPLTVIQFYSTCDTDGNNYRSKEEKEQAVASIKGLTQKQKDFLLGK